VLDGPHAEDSIYTRDPCELLKALAAAAEGLYLVALTNKQGEYSLASSSQPAAAASASDSDPAAAVAAAVKAGATLEGLSRSLDGLPVLQDIGAGPLLSKALEKLWKILQDRESFQYVEPAGLAAARAKAAAPDASGDNSSDSKGSKQDKEQPQEPEETAEEKKLRAAAEEAIAMAQVNFDENWHMYLKAVYATELVPLYAEVGMQLAAALLQVLAYKQVGTEGLLYG
jgi:hypothetical protein